MNNFITLIKHSLMSREGIIFIEQEIKLLFNLIAKTKCIEDAELLFSNLEDIQFVLAKAIFSDEIIATPFLIDFVSDFDRIDDSDVKEHLYKKIKSTIGSSL